jgi:hypothetical protein
MRHAVAHVLSVGISSKALSVVTSFISACLRLHSYFLQCGLNLAKGKRKLPCIQACMVYPIFWNILCTLCARLASPDNEVLLVKIFL